MSSSEDGSGSLLGWLGLRGGRRADAKGEGGGKVNDPFFLARRELLDEISQFLLHHELEVTGGNLLVAHGVISGANPGLARQIARQLAAGLPVSQQWLDETTAANAAASKDDNIVVLMTRLEATLENFAQNTTAARANAADYGEELAQHVAELDQVQQTGTIISNLADLAKAMLERTRRLEADMRASEDEASALRRSLEKAKRDAEVDHLTGLPNRRAFEEVLEREFREARLAVDPLVVAFCDIDHFKRINDSHGHEAGDRVIRAIADMLAGICNDNCHVARHGGEEFVLLFRGATLSEAKQRLDEVREKMAERRLINRKTDEAFGQITFSGGLADVFDYADPRAALKAADEALYAAKEAGRNQICIADKPARAS